MGREQQEGPPLPSPAALLLLLFGHCHFVACLQFLRICNGSARCRATCAVSLRPLPTGQPTNHRAFSPSLASSLNPARACRQIKDAVLQSARLDMRTSFAAGFVEEDRLLLLPVDEVSGWALWALARWMSAGCVVLACLLACSLAC